MAVRKIAMVVNLRQNKNQTSQGFGKWYPEVDEKKPLDLKGFCAHMTEHGKLADYQMVVLVVQQVVECMKELICQGQPVKLEGLGTFYPTIENKKGGVESPLAYDPNVQIEGVHLRFLPEGAKGEELTSRNLKGDCVFEMRDLITVHVVTVDGKKKRYQTRQPLATLALANSDQEPVEP